MKMIDKEVINCSKCKSPKFVVVKGKFESDPTKLLVGYNIKCLNCNNLELELMDN